MDYQFSQGMRFFPSKQTLSVCIVIERCKHVIFYLLPKRKDPWKKTRLLLSLLLLRTYYVPTHNVYSSSTLFLRFFVILKPFYCPLPHHSPSPSLIILLRQDTLFYDLVNATRLPYGRHTYASLYSRVGRRQNRNTSFTEE